MRAPRSDFWPVLLPAIGLLGLLGVFILLAVPGSEPAPPNPSLPKKPPTGMVLIPGGTFTMGSADPQFHDTRPVHKVTVDPFWMDETEVTNAQFLEFVKATGYRTVAEFKPDPSEAPGVPPEKLVAGSIVFTQTLKDVPLFVEGDFFEWQRWVPGANWNHPEGPGSDVADRMDHPVVHVAWPDAAAYARWAGKRLPTEAEWEYAARGGLAEQPFAWGRELQPESKWMTNIWQGRFPRENLAEDGFAGTAPVRSFPPNGHGLYDMAGNVWEWCADWYRADYYAISPEKNPPGPRFGMDPREPGVAKRVQRGGSFLCSDIYCVRYRMGSRGSGEVNSAAAHIGFRCVRSP